jgi:hypothetical protein
MKKCITFIMAVLLMISMLCFWETVFANCEYNWGSIAWELDSCLSGADLVNPGDGLIEGWIKNKIVYWTTQLVGLFSLLAVGAIVYGGLMMTLSWGEDEKIKKWKDIVKWAMLWFLWLIVAGWIIRVVIELMFSVAW